MRHKHVKELRTCLIAIQGQKSIYSDPVTTSQYCSEMSRTQKIETRALRLPLAPRK